MTETREIKFRGIPVNGIKEIRPDNSIGPIPFVHGGHCEVENKHYIILDDAELFSSNVDGEMIYGFIEVIPESVGQYTGLKERYGKEEIDVYEADEIVITDGDCAVLGVVKMNDEIGQWVWVCTEAEASALTVYKGKEIPLWQVLDKQHRWKGCLTDSLDQNPEFMETK